MEEPRDRVGIVLHAVFSGLLGAGCGCIALLLVSALRSHAVATIVTPAVVFALAGGAMGESFWEASWNPLRWLADLFDWS